jgi:hypothetical protein
VSQAIATEIAAAFSYDVFLLESQEKAEFEVKVLGQRARSDINVL